MKHNGLGRRLHLIGKLWDPAFPNGLLITDTGKWQKNMKESYPLVSILLSWKRLHRISQKKISEWVG